MTPVSSVTAPVLVPVPAIPGVDGDRGASHALCVDVCASGAASVALTTGGAVFTWGSGGVAGPSPSPTPAPIRELLLRGRIRSIAVGRAFALALTAVGGEVWAWGEDSAGAGVLGGGWSDSGGGGSVRAPARVDGFPSPHARITAIAAGASHALALSATGRIFSWGSNADGALGLGALGPPSESALRRAGVFAGAPPARDRADAVPLPALVWALEHHCVVSLTAGARASAAITDTGSVFVWGATAAAAPCVNASALIAVAAGARALVPAKLASQLLNPAPGARGGPPEACYVPSPTLVDGASTTLPARYPRRLLFPHSPAASALVLLYTTAHLKEAGLRAAAASLASLGVPSTGGGVGGGAPPGAVVDALLFHDPREQLQRGPRARSPSAASEGGLSARTSAARTGVRAADVLRNRASGASLLSAVLSSLGAPVAVAPAGAAALTATSGPSLDLITDARATLLAHPTATAALATLHPSRLRKLSLLARVALAAQLGAIARRATADEAAERTSERAATRASARAAAYGAYASPIASAAARSADAYASPFTGPASPAPLPPPAPSLAALLNSPRLGSGRGDVGGSGEAGDASGFGSSLGWGERVAPSSSKNAAVILDLLGARADARADAALSPLDCDDETDAAIARRAGRLAATLQSRMLQSAASNALAFFSPMSRPADAQLAQSGGEAPFSERLRGLLLRETTP